MLIRFYQCGRWMALAIAVFSGGCSHEAALYSVSGNVSLDGQPVGDGDILFITPDGSHGPDPGKIKDGKYSLQTTKGPKRVEVSASKIKPGGARGAGGEPVPEECIPARYNTESALTADVRPEVNTISFELTTGRPGGP
jgi:hypothetical protein